MCFCVSDGSEALFLFRLFYRNKKKRERIARRIAFFSFSEKTQCGTPKLKIKNYENVIGKHKGIIAN